MRGREGGRAGERERELNLSPACFTSKATGASMPATVEFPLLTTVGSKCVMLWRFML